MTDLESAHVASRGWIESENDKIAQWGKGEIAQIVERTRGMEQQLVEAAKIKQRELDEQHGKDLQAKVQEMDLAKAAKLKELQDSMQQQIQVRTNAHAAHSAWAPDTMKRRRTGMRIRPSSFAHARDDGKRTQPTQGWLLFWLGLPIDSFVFPSLHCVCCASHRLS